ncbi:MAG: hypothetical protein HYY93_14010 [Planctomycetes bacterium]|nr:hypothetical protein [Planctomycetota bacterium]
MAIEFSCFGCGSRVKVDDSLAGKKAKCPKCAGVLTVPAATTAPVPAPPGGAGTLPLTMAANRQVSGRPCAACAKEIRFGEEIRNCGDCGRSYHQSCWRGGCVAPACPGARKSAPEIPAAGGAPADKGKPCPSCGEPNPFYVTQCRHCGSIVNREAAESLPAVLTAGAESKKALAFAVLGLFCCGFIFGWLAVQKANEANTARTQAGLPKSTVATIALVLGIIDIVGWAAMLVLRQVGRMG